MKDWLDPLITSVGVLITGILIAWWQYGGRLAARRRRLSQELEMLQLVPLEDPAGRAYAMYVRNAVHEYAYRADGRSWWRRALATGTLFICPYVIYRIWTDRESLTGQAWPWLVDHMSGVLLGLAAVGGFFMLASFLVGDPYDENSPIEIFIRWMEGQRDRFENWLEHSDQAAREKKARKQAARLEEAAREEAASARRQRP